MQDYAEGYIVRVIALTLLAFFLATNSLYAAEEGQEPSVPPTCNADFMEIIETRALMEAKREVDAAEALILKPDSVLEYSCFDEVLYAVARHGGAIFTENTQSTLFSSPAFEPEDDFQPTFQPEPGPTGENSEGEAASLISDTTLDSALGSVVQASLMAYLENNFGHTFAGGRLENDSGSPCGAMALVWDFMRCQNFEKADFMTFSELMNEDPRTLPGRCVEEGRAEFWEAAMGFVNPDPVDPSARDQSWGVDAVAVLSDLITSGTCADPIPTGVLGIYTASGSKTFVEAVCPNPACSHTPSDSGDLGTCD